MIEQGYALTKNSYIHNKKYSVCLQNENGQTHGV